MDVLTLTSMLASRTLSTADERQQFATRYQQHARGIPLELDYLNRSAVRVFFKKSDPDHWVGGYVLNLTVPLRYLDFLGASRQAHLLAPYGMRLDDFVEISGAWLDKPYINLLERAQFYTAMMLEAYRTQRPGVLAGSFNEKSQALQRRVMPHVLFDAEHQRGSVVGRAQIYFGYRRGMLGRYFKAAVVDTWRRFWKLKRPGASPGNGQSPGDGSTAPNANPPISEGVDLPDQTPYVVKKTA